MPDLNQELIQPGYNRILSGAFKAKDCSLDFLEKFLKILLKLPSCPTSMTNISSSAINQTSLPCIESGESPILKQHTFLKDLLKNNQLKNIFNYLKSVIDQHANNIQIAQTENLLDFCDNFFQIPIHNPTLNLTVSAIGGINQAFFDFFASLTKLPKIIEISDPKGNLKIFDIMHLSKGYLTRIQKLNANVSIATEPSNLTYSIFEPMKNYLEGLGNLALKFGSKYPNELGLVEKKASDLVNLTTLLTFKELENIKYIFIKQYNNLTDIDKKCLEIFKTGCDPDRAMEMQDETPSPITLIPETTSSITSGTTTTTFAPQVIANATFASIINQTKPEIIVHPNPITELPSYSNGTLSNQTDVNNIENIENNPASSVPYNPASVTVAAGYSVISGTFNAWVRHFYPNMAKLTIIGNSTLAAGLPLVLYVGQEHLEAVLGPVSQDQINLTGWDMAWQIPTDLASALLTNLALYYATDASNNLSSSLSNYPKSQFAIKNIVPFAATLASIAVKPVQTAVYIAASTAISFSASGLFNRIWPRKKINSFDVEADVTSRIEMQPLKNEEKAIDMIATNKNITTQKREISSEELFLKMGFSTLEKFNELLTILNKTIKNVTKLQGLLNDKGHVERLQKILKDPNIKLGLSYDLEDLNKFMEGFKLKYHLCINDEERNEIVKAKFNYFKTAIKNTYDKILSDDVNSECISRILHLIKDSTNLIDKISNLIKLIEVDMSNIRTIVKPIISIHINQNNGPNEPPFLNGNTIFRQQNTSHSHPNNRHTYHASSDSRNETRLSTASSSCDSTGTAKSDGLGNTQFDNSSSQEQEALLNTRLAR